jgi:four helix bundle protein
MKREPAKSFQDLIVWQRSHCFVISVYQLSSCFPKYELYGLTSQLRRAAVSVPANIAEVFKKRTKPDKARYYNIAQASVEECRYYLMLVQELNYGATGEQQKLLEEISKLLERYVNQIKVSAT